MSRQSPRWVPWYYVVVGIGSMVAGIVWSSWGTEVIGLGLLFVGVATVLDRGEWTSLIRDEMDERRRRAADHGFKIAFFVLAWWIGAISFYSSYHHVSTGVWGAGNAIALAAAYVDYAVVLRRT
jgi:hypothetical protein